MRVADYITKFLVSKGISDIFVLTGNGAMYLDDAIVQQEGLNYFCVRHEVTAPLMASAYAQLKKVPGAICVTAGPGATNTVAGLVEPWIDSAPVMVISGQVDRAVTTHNLQDREGVRTFGAAEIDIVPIVKSVTKYAVMVNEAESIRYHMEKAYHLATTGRPGPVWIDVPMDIQYAEINEAKLVGYNPEENGPAVDKNKIDQLMKQLSQASRPLVVAGHGISLAEAETRFKTFIEKSGIPFIHTRFANNLLPYSHPQNFGIAGIKGTRFCKKLAAQADFVLVLGARLAPTFLGPKLDLFSPKTKVAMVDIAQSEISKPGLKIDFPVVSDVGDFLSLAMDQIPSTMAGKFQSWLRTCQSLKDQFPMITPEMKKDPIDLYYFMSRLDALTNNNNVLVTDAGSNYYVGGQVYRFENQQKEVSSVTYAAMGLSIPLAMGASVAAPDKTIVAVTGDGSLELNVQELKTISYYRRNIKLFVINNGGYASMRNWQDSYFDGRRIGSDDDTGAETLNLFRVAQAFGMPYDRIDRVDQIDMQVQQILNQRGPLFIEVMCDPNQKIIEPMKELTV
jgi:acetolactate synthase I/II/III large subunit